MTTFIPFSRDQAFLLPPDAKDWLPADDVAHFVVERVPLGAFAVRLNALVAKPARITSIATRKWAAVRE